jgi:fructose-1,6-bisphosphatase I
MLQSHVVTISRFLVDQQRLHPEATGAFTDLLSDIALAAKVISREVNQAGLVDILGSADDENVHGEEQQKLDVFANQVVIRALDHTGHVACMASEESEEVIPIPEKFEAGEYVVIFDPLDGSSNIDVNVSIGTIFSIHRKQSDGERGCLEDCLQPGYRQVAAGYVLYGSSTMLVYTSGAGVHGFTLDPSIGEFLLSHPQMRIPTPPKKVYSINEAYFTRWSPAQQRLVYEAAPMAMIVEQAGGKSSDGYRSLLEIVPGSLHERTPIYMGSKELVELAEKFLAEGD